MPEPSVSETAVAVAPPITDLLFPITISIGGEVHPAGEFQALRLMMSDAPLFSQAEADKLSRSSSEVQTLTDQSGKRWRPLSTWLEDPARAVVLCRRGGLTVKLQAADHDISLLAFDQAADGQSRLAATLHPGGGQPDEPIPLVQLDRDRGYLQLTLPFEDSDAGREHFTRIVAALSAPSSEARVELDYTHTLAVGDPGSGDPGKISDSPVIVLDPGWLPKPTGMTAAGHWESLGGTLAGGADVCSWSEGRLDVFVRGMDSALWHRWYDGGAWSDWESLGGQISSDPGAVSWANGRLDVFARGMDDALWHKWYDGAWSDWESLGGGLSSGPDVCAWAPGRLDVFARGMDDALWHLWYDGGWSDWESLGGQISSDPGAVSWANGRLDVFARGMDNALWHRWFDGGWSDWEPLGGGLSSGPDVSSWGPGRLDVFALGTDHALWHRWFDNGWSDWEGLGGELTADPGAVSWAKGRLDVFSRGQDQALWHHWFDGSWRSAPAVRPRPALDAAAVTVFAEAPAVALQPLVFTRPGGFNLLRLPPRFGQDEPPQGSGVRQVTVHQAHPIPAGRSRSEQAEAYPDLPKPGQGMWTELPARTAGGPALFFRASERGDIFFHLPTAYRLGFHVQGDAADAHPPMRPVFYRAAAPAPDADRDRIEVTLTAIPVIDAADREYLRAHIQDRALGGVLPFVRLAPASGLAAAFDAPFTAAGGVLPQGVTWRGEALAPDRELTFRFDMPARLYPIFCEMLRQGLHGRVDFSGDGLRRSVDVLLDFRVLVADGLRVGALPVGEDGAVPVSIENPLDYAVRLASVRAFLMDQGSDEIPDLIFRAESHELLTEPRRLARRGEAGAAAELRVPPGSSGTSWDHLAVALGTTEVDGGTPAEWLDRVHRDPSLQPLDFAVQVSASFPASARDRIEGVHVALLHPGDATARAERMIRPGDPPWNLRVSLGLGELAAISGQGSGGALPTFVLESYTGYHDLGAGLPERILLDLNSDSAVVRALAETAASHYTIVHGTAREEGKTRAEAEAAIGRLRTAGEVWQLFVEAATDTSSSTTPTTTSTSTATEGPAFSMVTNLLEAWFQDGRLESVLVTLSARDEGAPTTTFRFDPQNRREQTWHAPAGSTPPYKYRVLYLYRGGVFRQVDGQEQNLLVLDPPAI